MVAKDIHRRECAESHLKMLCFQEAKGRKTGPWSRVVIHRRFFDPACIPVRPLSRSSVSSKPVSRNGEKSGLSEYDVFRPYNTHGCKCTHQKDQGKQPYQDSDGNRDGTARHFSQPT